MSRGAMNVAAQDGVDLKFLGVANNRFFEFADEANRVLYALFCVGAERPVAEPESPSEKVDRWIKREQKLITKVAKMGEPFRALHDGIELVAVNHEHAASICRLVDRMFLDGNISVRPGEATHELVVISG